MDNDGYSLEDCIAKFGYNSPEQILVHRKFYESFPAANSKWGKLVIEKAEEIMRYEETIRKLENGESVENSEGGSSMLPIIKPYQRVLLSPIPDKSKLEKGDIVLAKVNGRYFLHKISAFDGKRVQISNNHGHVNGWTTRNKIYGIVTKIYK